LYRWGEKGKLTPVMCYMQKGRLTSDMCHVE